MSADLIRQLLETHSLNPTPIGDHVIETYVPFDDVLGTENTEGALFRAMNAGVRVSIVGPSGAGKSSLCEWVLGAPDGEFAAMRVPVSVEADETVTDPAAFAQHVIRTVSKHAQDSALISPDDRRTMLKASSDRMVRPGHEVTKKAGLGLPSWFLKGELATEVTRYVESVDQRRSGITIVETLAYLIDLIARHGLRPVFVIDDSDSWLNIEGVRDRSPLVNEFFGPVLRTMAELPCGLVVAVHEEYLDTRGFRQAEGFLERTIRVPALPSASAVALLLDHRIKICDDTAGWDSAFTEGAVAALFGYYSGAANLSVRKALQAAQSGLYFAADNQAEHVSEEMIDAGISDWG